METQERQETWPVVAHSDVTDFCRAICETILRLEQAFEAGELSSSLTSGRFEEDLGPRLYETYGKLAEAAHAPKHRLRLDAVRALLAQLQNDLVPTQIANVKVLIPPEGDLLSAETETDSRPRLGFKRFDANFDGRSSTMIRFDQMLDARFWRIGFTFETVDLCDAYAQEVVRSATNRLASDLLGLQRILERFSPTSPEQALKIVPYPRDKRFEHLILDILNEDGRHAHVAPLLEDFLEKTDLRVKYPELKRRRGGRVQITSIVAPDLHEAKLNAIRLAEEFVFLSPLSLAQFVKSLEGNTLVGSISGTSSFTLGALWECLKDEPTHVPQLASELKRIIFRALTRAPNSPLGPLVEVPLPIRQLIRFFVKTHAIASTSKLRERESGSLSDLAALGREI